MERDEFIKLIEEKVPKGGKIYVNGVGLFSNMDAPIISNDGIISNIDNELYLIPGFQKCSGRFDDLECSNGYVIEQSAIDGRWVITPCSKDHPGWRNGCWTPDEDTSLGEYDSLEDAIIAWSDLPDRRKKEKQ